MPNFNEPRNIDAAGAKDRVGTLGTLSGNWTTDEPYWRETLESRPYARADRGWEHYGPAYRFAYDLAPRYPGRQWDEVHDEFASQWPAKDESSTWENVKDAVRDAWDRLRGK